MNKGQDNNLAPQQVGENDFEFRHQLRDKIILLGGPIEIANLLTQFQDYSVSAQDVDSLLWTSVGYDWELPKKPVKNPNHMDSQCPTDRRIVVAKLEGKKYFAFS